jgi:4'-phosphopantetheinyl transferase
VASRDVVRLWWVPANLPPAWCAVLSEEERRRYAAYADGPARRTFLAARAAIRMLLAERLGTTPDAVPLGTGRWGKPYVAGAPEFSLSHAGDWAVVALSAYRPVGIDVDLPHPGQDPLRSAARFFRADEHELVRAAPPEVRAATYLRMWARKEACVKAAGGRLAFGLRLPVAGPVVVDATGRLGGPWRVRDLAAPPGYTGAVALTGPRPFRIVSRRLVSAPRPAVW